MFCWWPSARGTGDDAKAPALALALVFAFPFLRLKAISVFFFFLFARVRGRLTITMKPHPKLRKTIKWGGAAVTVLLVVVWIGSMWFALIRRSGANMYDVSSGAVSLDVWDTKSGVPPPPSHGWQLRMHNASMCWWYTWDKTRGWGEYVLPLWPVVFLSVAVALVAWRRDFIARRRRRALLNLCPKCNYDRAGIAAGAVCPECGERPTVG